MMGGRHDWWNGRCGTSFRARHWFTLNVCGMVGLACSIAIHLVALFILVYCVVGVDTSVFLVSLSSSATTPSSSSTTMSNNNNSEKNTKYYHNNYYNMESSSTTTTDASTLGWISAISTLVFYGLYGPSTVLALISLFRAATTNPGAVPLGARPFTTVTRLTSTTLSCASSSEADVVVCPPVSSSSSSSSSLAETATATLRPQHPQDTSTSGTATDHRPLPTPPSSLPQTDSNNNNSRLPRTTSTTSTSRRRRSIRRCPKCADNYKPPRAHHDSVTGRCIVKFDHYCPWINNAVGALNHKFFCLFLLYTATACTASLLLILLQILHCSNNNNEYGSQPSSSSEATSPTSASSSTTSTWLDSEGGRLLLHRIVAASTSSLHDFRQSGFPAVLFPEQCQAFVGNPFVLALATASVLFLTFTVSMGCEQLEAIRSGKGKIARMKQRVGATGTEFSRVTTEFNEMFGGTRPTVAWHWFLPLTVRFPKGMKQVVLGYEFNDTCDAAGAYREPGEDDTDGDTNNNNNSHANDPQHDNDGYGRMEILEAGLYNNLDNAPLSSEPSVLSTLGGGATFHTANVGTTMREEDGLFLNGSSEGGAVKNRRHSKSADDNNEGITLVERTKTRLS